MTYHKSALDNILIGCHSGLAAAAATASDGLLIGAALTGRFALRNWNKGCPNAALVWLVGSIFFSITAFALHSIAKGNYEASAKIGSPEPPLPNDNEEISNQTLIRIILFAAIVLYPSHQTTSPQLKTGYTLL